MDDLPLVSSYAEDQARARELYKYFRPPDNGSAPVDSVLTAHVQLVAWRLNAERAMVSYIDNETQYFVAESTKTLHLDDSLSYDDPDDAIWAGVGSFWLWVASTHVLFSAPQSQRQVGSASTQWPPYHRWTVE
jgi:hypothetical protein